MPRVISALKKVNFYDKELSVNFNRSSVHILIAKLHILIARYTYIRAYTHLMICKYRFKNIT